MQQIQVFYDALWSQREYFGDGPGDFGFVNNFRTLAIDQNTDGFGNTNRIRQLHLAGLGEFGSNNVFRDVTGHVTGRAVNLRRIFPAEGSTTVRASTTISIHNNFTPCHTRITIRPTDNKTTRRIDMELDPFVPQFRIFRMDDRFNNFFDNLVTCPFRHVTRALIDDLCVIDVLRRNNHSVNSRRNIIYVLNGNLTFPVGKNPVELTVFTNFREFFGKAMRKIDR